MEENLFEILSYFTLGDQDLFQSEEEDLEKIKRELGCIFIGGLGNELGDIVNGYKDERQKNISRDDSFLNVIFVVELNNILKNYFFKEDDDLFLSLLLMLNENFIICLIMI